MLDDKYFGFKGVFAQLQISVNKLETHSVYHLHLRLKYFKLYNKSLERVINTFEILWNFIFRDQRIVFLY